MKCKRNIWPTDDRDFPYMGFTLDARGILLFCILLYLLDVVYVLSWNALLNLDLTDAPSILKQYYLVILGFCIVLTEM